MVCVHKPYDRTDREARRQAIASAIGSQRAEGLELDDESLADFDEFVSGAITIDEVKARAEARYNVNRLSSSIES